MQEYKQNIAALAKKLKLEIPLQASAVLVRKVHFVDEDGKDQSFSPTDANMPILAYLKSKIPKKKYGKQVPMTDELRTGLKAFMAEYWTASLERKSALVQAIQSSTGIMLEVED